jgi:hypothetical protein
MCLLAAMHMLTRVFAESDGGAKIERHTYTHGRSFTAGSKPHAVNANHVSQIPVHGNECTADTQRESRVFEYNNNSLSHMHIYYFRCRLSRNYFVTARIKTSNTNKKYITFVFK